jgi:enoyl-CoA hydratase
MDVLREIEQALRQLADKPPRVLIITGAKHVLSKEDIEKAKAKGKEPKPMPAAFVDGADIKAMPSMNLAQAREFVEQGQRVMQMLEDAPYPVIAAVDGFALGGGTELSISCDIIYASTRSKFGQPEVNLGIIPGFGGTQRLMRLINRNRAKELIYSGEHIGADEAFRMGLANKVLPPDELMPAVEKLALTICSKAPLAIKYSKQACNRGHDRPLPEANLIELECFLASVDTQDRIEGTTAFIEKRTPHFTGK